MYYAYVYIFIKDDNMYKNICVCILTYKYIRIYKYIEKLDARVISKY